MELVTVWFIVIAVLWTGYFVLEGFDFGVGALLPVLGRDNADRQAMLSTIGPVWDGNEVWLITAAGATFAAFPEWYATLFSSFYLPLLVILVALILRGVALEYRGKRDDESWQKRWDAAIVFGSIAPAFLWGVAFANIVGGLPIDQRLEFTGNVVDLLHPYALLGGVTTLALFGTHGATFLGLKTTEQLRARANAFGSRLGLVAAVLMVAFLAWTFAIRSANFSVVCGTVAVLCFAGALVANRLRREGWAFTGTAVTIGLTVAALFLTLFPFVMPSTVDPAYGLTVHNASSTPYTLTIMTWVAGIFAPVVVIYQGWTYWVFRKRVTRPRTAEA